MVSLAAKGRSGKRWCSACRTTLAREDSRAVAASVDDARTRMRACRFRMRTVYFGEKIAASREEPLMFGMPNTPPAICSHRRNSRLEPRFSPTFEGGVRHAEQAPVAPSVEGCTSGLLPERLGAGLDYRESLSVYSACRTHALRLASFVPSPLGICPSNSYPAGQRSDSSCIVDDFRDRNWQVLGMPNTATALMVSPRRLLELPHAPMTAPRPSSAGASRRPMQESRR